ncbi:MAG: hypothetical protein GY906_06575 [bacterium]|nr:hypothetical protein [bacterium]
MKGKRFLVSIALLCAVLSMSPYVYAQNGHIQDVTWRSTGGPNGLGGTAIEHTTTGAVLVGTAGEKARARLLRSHDDGRTWQSALKLEQDAVVGIASSPNGYVFVTTGKGSVYRSGDDGRSWSKIQDQALKRSLGGLFVAQDETVIAATWDGLFTSTDNGLSWNKKDSGYFRSIAGDVNGILYAGRTQRTGGQTGVSRSFDNGVEWQPTAEIQSASGSSSIIVFSLATNSRGEVFAGTTDGLYRSADKGDSWTLTTLGDKRVWSLIVDENDTIVAGADGWGIYYSIDNGQTWIETNVDHQSVRGGFSISPHNGSLWVAASRAVFRTRLPSLPWETVGVSMPTIDLATVGESLFAVSGFEGIVSVVGHSGSNDDSWEDVGSWDNRAKPLSMTTRSGKVLFFGLRILEYPSATVLVWAKPSSPYAYQHSLDEYSVIAMPSLLFISDSELLIGTDRGLFYVSSITPSTFPDPPVPIGLNDLLVNELTRWTDGFVYAATRVGIYRSPDGVSRWTYIGPNGVNALSVARKADGQIYVGTAESGVFHSADDGQHWESRHAGMLESEVPVMAVTAAGSVYSGTPNGLYRWSETDKRWNTQNTGLTNLDIRKLVVTDTDDLIVGTALGVYRAQQSLSPRTPRRVLRPPRRGGN